jgi:hypothetical protein
VKAEYTLTLEDVLALAAYYYDASATLRRQRQRLIVLALILLGLCGLLIYVVDRRNLSLGMAFLAGVVAYYVYLFFRLVFFGKKQHLRATRQIYGEAHNRAVFCKQRMLLTPQGIESRD